MQLNFINLVASKSFAKESLPNATPETMCINLTSGNLRHYFRLFIDYRHFVLYNLSMELGICTATFFNVAKTEDTLELVRRYGFNVCEVFLTTFCEYESDFARVLSDRLMGVRVHSVHDYTTSFEPMLFNPAERTRRDGEKLFEKVLSAGKILGAQNYTFHGQSRLKKTTKYDFPLVSQRYEELALWANEYGMDLCLENVHWAINNEPCIFEIISSGAPHLKATLDIKQARQAGVDYNEFIKVYGNRLKTVHISDFDENGNTCLPFEGTVDYEKLFKTLKDSGYDGPVLIELYSKDYQNLNALYAPFDRLKEIMGKVNNG